MRPSGHEIRSIAANTGDVVVFISTATVSSDGRNVCIGYDDGSIVLWDLASGVHRILCGNNLRGKDVPTLVRSVSFSPDGHTLATAADTLKLWDITSGREMRTLVPSPARVTAMAFSHDGRTLAGGREGNNSILKLWDTASGRELRVLVSTGEVEALTFSPNGHTLVSAHGNGRIKVWDPASGTRDPDHIRARQSNRASSCVRPKRAHVGQCQYQYVHQQPNEALGRGYRTRNPNPLRATTFNQFAGLQP